MLEVLFFFLNADKVSETKIFFRGNGLISPTNCKTQNLLHMTLFTLNFVAVIALKQNTTTTLIYWEVKRPENKLLPNELIEATNYWDWEPSLTARNTEARANDFVHRLLLRHNIKMFCPFWRQCTKWLLTTTTKKSIRWNLLILYQTLPTFVYTSLQIGRSIP